MSPLRREVPLFSEEIELVDDNGRDNREVA